MIRGVVFDLGGTLVDKYSLSSVLNLRKALNHHKVTLPDSLIARDIGLGLYDHITHLSYEQSFRDEFLKKHGRPHTYRDLNEIYECFNEHQTVYMRDALDVVPEAVKTLRNLQEKDIKIGITTGFNRDQMDLCLDVLSKYEIYPDSAVSSTCLDYSSRPEQHMIQMNMITMGIDNPKEILKVDDTIVGIAEGHYADCICVGVARWSVNMNIYTLEDKYKYDYEKFKGELEYDEYRMIVRDKLKECRTILHLAEPCYLINTLYDLDNCLF